MLRQMKGTRPFAALLSMAAVAILGTSAMAASPSAMATSDLIAGPPSGSWTVSSYTGTLGVSDIYADTSSVPGFLDAYRKAWDQPAVGLYDDLVHYSSLFWADYALANFKAGVQSDSSRSSFQSLGGFGAGAFEVTYPADTDGYKWDEIYFAVGDYVAKVSFAATGTVARDVLLDQAARQLALLPAPTAELRSLGARPLTGVLGAGPVIVGVVLFIVAAIVLIVVLARRSRAPAVAGRYAVPYGSPVVARAGPIYSDDRRHWWDGQVWQDTMVWIPPGVRISPDGTVWWDGAAWRPMPSAGGVRS